MKDIKEKYGDTKAGIINTYRRLIPKEVKGGEVSNIVITAVLHKGYFDNKAVYLGKSDNLEWVKKQGTKLSYDEALAYFPGLNKENYRK